MKIIGQFQIKHVIIIFLLVHCMQVVDENEELTVKMKDT